MSIYDKALDALEKGEKVTDPETLEQLDAYGNELQDDIDQAQQTMDKIEDLL